MSNGFFASSSLGQLLVHDMVIWLMRFGSVWEWVRMIVNGVCVRALIRLTGSMTVLVVVKSRVFTALHYTMISHFVPHNCHKGCIHFPFVNLFSFKKIMLPDYKKSNFQCASKRNKSFNMHGSQPVADALTQIAKWEQEEENCRRNRESEREEMGEGLEQSALAFCTMAFTGRQLTWSSYE